MASKTPVSTLQEMFIVKGITPYYDLIVNGAGTHNPIFKYRLGCGDIVAYGVGKSKKEAKHDAAQNALNQLKNNGQPLNTNEGLLEKMDVDEANIPAASSSPYQDVLKHNVVGTLTALCASNRISEPVYELIGEEGPPHCKIFTIECSVMHLKEVAQARTKKQAKHKSSKQMLDTLLEYSNNCLDLSALEEVIDARPPKEVVIDNRDKEETEEVIKKYISMQKNKPVVENAGLRISDYHIVSPDNNAFLLHPNFENLKNIEIEKIPHPYSYVVGTLFEDLEVELDWYDMPPLKNYDYIKSVIVHSNPSWCFMGAGETEVKALTSCAIEMLRFFQTLLS
nr:R2D2 [Sogatella furcifera]